MRNIIQAQILFVLITTTLVGGCVSRTQFDAAVASRTGTERDLHVARTDLSDATNDVDELTGERNELGVLLESANIRVRDVETQLEERQNAIESLNVELTKLKASDAQSRDAQIAMTTQIATAITVLLDQLKEIESQTQTSNAERARLSQKLTKTARTLNETRANLATAQTRGEKLSSENNRLTASLAQVRSNITIASEKHSGATKELEQSKAALDKALKKIKRLNKELGQAQSSLEDIQQSATLLKHEKEKLLADNELLAKTTRENNKLVKKLNKEIGNSKVKIRSLSGRVQVDLPTAILFPSGTKELSRRGQQALQEIAEVLSGVSNRVIRVYGHTDNIPVNAGASFVDNLGLSAMRASRVVSHLVANGVEPTIIAPVGLGEHFPIGDNETKDGRATNRRIEIILIPKLTATVEATP